MNNNDKIRNALTRIMEAEDTRIAAERAIDEATEHKNKAIEHRNAVYVEAARTIHVVHGQREMTFVFADREFVYTCDHAGRSTLTQGRQVTVLQ